MAVEALIDEELPPGAGAIGIQALAAFDLGFGAEIEAGVRVDQQQRVAAGGAGGGQRHAVGAGRFGPFAAEVERRQPGRLAGVEGLQPGEIDAFDVAADAAFAERQRHPGFEAGDDARFHLRVRGQIMIERVGPGGAQAFQPARRGLVLRLQLGRIDEQLHPEVAPDGAFALGLGQAALRVDEVGFDAIEIILRLGVDHAEHGVGVGLALDVGDAPIITGDGDSGLAGGPAIGFGRGQRRDGENGREEQGADHHPPRLRV